MEETREIDIDLRKILYMMRTKLVFIAIITIIFGTAAGLYTKFFISPTYSTSVSMCVYNSPDRVTTDRVTTQSEITAAQQLVGTYMFALKSDLVLDKVAEELKLGSGASIRGSISTEAQSGTFAFTVTVTGQDPTRCADIANTIAKIAPVETVKVVKSGGVEVIDTAKTPTAPISPNLRKNILIGLAVGFALSFAGFFIYEMFDSTITNVKDLAREFELPVLGTVPMLESIEDTSTDSDGDENKDKDKPLDKPKEAIPKPSSALLENIQNMKGDAKND